MTQYFTQWHSYFMDADRILEVLAAIVISMVIGMVTGPLGGNANPLFWSVFSGVFGGFGEKLDRAHRPKADLMFRGFMLGCVMMMAAAALAKFYLYILTVYPSYEVVNIVFLTLLLTSGTIWFVLLKLYFAMDRDKVGEGAYYAIARTTRINLASGDDYGITRAAMSLSVKSFDKGMVAPALWYIIGGFPAACIYAALAMMSWRFGRNGLGSGFASVPLALEKLMGIIPSLLAALYLTLAATFTPTAKLHKGIAAWLGHKNRAPYEQGGAPLSAMAWALNVSLGGAVQDLSGKPLKGEWVGPEGATAQLNHKHLRRAIYINVIAHILFIASLLGMYMWSSIL